MNHFNESKCTCHVALTPRILSHLLSPPFTFQPPHFSLNSDDLRQGVTESYGGEDETHSRIAYGPAVDCLVLIENFDLIKKRPQLRCLKIKGKFYGGRGWWEV